MQDTVAAPIEQQVVGVENMLYMSSQSANDGSYTLTVTFALGTDLNMAQVLVQNRVAQALPLLPDVVQQTGVTTKKKSPSILLAVNLFPKHPQTNGRLRPALHSNYATIQVARRAGPHRRGRRRDDPGPAGLQHAGLARSRPAGGAQSDGRRRGQRDARAECPGRGRSGWPAAGPLGARFSSSR